MFSFLNFPTIIYDIIRLLWLIHSRKSRAAITSIKEVLFVVSVGWLVCNQDYTKSNEPTSTKLGLRTSRGPESSPSTFDVDLDYSDFQLKS